MNQPCGSRTDYMRTNRFTGEELLEIFDIGNLENDANSGTMLLQLMEFDGRKGKELSSSEREPQRVMGAYRRGMVIKNQYTELALDITNYPNLVEYDGNTLTFYYPVKGTKNERGNIHFQYRVLFDNTLPPEESKELKKYRELFS